MHRPPFYHCERAVTESRHFLCLSAKAVTNARLDKVGRHQEYATFDKPHNPPGFSQSILCPRKVIQRRLASRLVGICPLLKRRVRKVGADENRLGAALKTAYVSVLAQSGNLTASFPRRHCHLPRIHLCGSKQPTLKRTMEPDERVSRFRKHRGDGILLKLNRSALNIPVGDDNKPLRFWLDQAKRSLKTASSLR